MANRATADLASPFGTFKAGDDIPDGAVPDAVLAAWAEAGAIEAAVVAAPEAAVPEPVEAAVVAAPEARARTRKAQ